MRISRSYQLLLALILLFFCQLSWAQLNTADVTGFVCDRTNAAIVGAAVQMTNISTGVQRGAKTNTSGRFVIPALIPGTYTVQILKTGFAAAQLENITLKAGEVRDLQVKMEVGATNQVVDVVTSDLINTDNPEQITTLGSHQIDLLPTASRDWTNLVTQGNGLAMNNSRGTLIMNGLPSGGFRFTVDGVDAEGQPSLPSFSQYQNYNLIKGVSKEAIQEVSITRGIAAADVGGTMSGNVNVITKSGTDQMHGDVFWLNNVTVFNARNQFVKTRQPIIYNQYAASLGGPIIPHKLFYFGAYEGYHLSSQSSVSGTVPTPQFRAAALAAQPIYKPWFDIFPDPNTPYKPTDTAALFQGSGSQTGQDNYGDLRVDYYPAKAWQTIFRYTRARPDQLTPNIAPLNPQTRVGYTEGGSASVLYTRNDFLSESRFGFNYNDEKRVNGLWTLGVNSIRKFSGIDAGSGENLFQGGLTMTIEEKVTKTFNHHIFKFGGNYLRRLAQRADVQVPELQYANQSDFFKNIPNAIQVTYGVSLYNLRTYEVGTFFQDDWKLSDRLTINAGVRWDYFAPAYADDDRFYNRSGPFGLGPYLPAGTSWNSQWSSASPRVGFTYRADKNGNTVIRSGFGAFYSPHVLFGGPIGQVRDSLTAPTRANFSRNDVLKYGSLLQFPVVNAATLPLAVTTDSTSVIDTNYPNPYSLQWLLSVEQQLSRNWAFDLSYVGNHGIHLTTTRQINQPDILTGNRPSSNLGTFNFYDATESSNYNALQASLTRRFANHLSWNLYYTWAKALSHTDEADIISPVALQNPFSLDADYGPASSDIRNRLTSNFVYQPLFSEILGHHCKPLLCDGWQIAGVVTAQSGNPINIVQSSGLASSRPDATGAQPILTDYRNTRRYLTALAFTKVPLNAVSGLPIHFGNESRNGVYGPGLFNADLSLARGVTFHERFGFRFQAEMLNAFNHTNYVAVTSDVTSSSFGQITSSAGARVVQFSGKFQF